MERLVEFQDNRGQRTEQPMNWFMAIHIASK